MNSHGRTQIVILGAGFGGVYTAMHLEKLLAHANSDQFPDEADTFRFKFHGLFYVAPAQNSYMCRLRISNGILKHWQVVGLADLGHNQAAGLADELLAFLESIGMGALLADDMGLGKTVQAIAACEQPPRPADSSSAA